MPALKQRVLTPSLGLALLAAAPPAPAPLQRDIPFWPDTVPAAIHAEVDGGAALEMARTLGRFHRVQGSPGYSEAAEFLRRRLTVAGLSGVEILRFPADGTTRYAHFRSYLGWTADAARLEEVSPTPRRLSSFPELPVALADYSQDTDVTAELVDVGAGTEARDYEGRAIAGRIALADGPLPLVHRLAVMQRGAVGFLSAFPNQTTAWSGEDPDQVRWGHLSPYEPANTFAFMVSRREAGRLRQRLAAGERIVLRARVQARMGPAAYEVLTATLPGTDRGAEEIVFTAHLCHQSAGANDNASGSAAIFEVARALQAAIRKGALPAPRRTLRFLWVPEIAGSQAFLASRPETARRLVAGIHMDMVGGLLSTTHGTFHLSRTAESLPHVANVVAEVWLGHLTRATAAHAERGGDPYRGFVWPPGSREMLLGDLRGIELGSDHQVFQESSYGVPMLYFHDWPDATIHTNRDQPENLDPTKLGRVAYLGAGIGWTLAALPDAEAPRLLAVSRAAAAVAVAQAEMRAATQGSTEDGLLFRREAALAQAAMLRTVATLMPGVAVEARDAAGAMERAAPRRPADATRDARVPVRSPEVRGPLGVYYYDHAAEILGPEAATETALQRRDDGELLAWEALNLVDGKRSVSDIRDILAGRYAWVPVQEVAAHLAFLERLRVVSFKSN